MRVAILTTDNRDHHRRYDLADPYFGPAIEALLQGLAQRPELEVHVISCTQQPMRTSEKLAPNTFFHLLHVPKIGWLRTGYQGCIRAIRRKVREIRPAIVHGQGTERECSLGAVFSGFPNVITIHGNVRAIAKTITAKPGSYWWLMARLEEFTLPRSRGIVCNSRHTQSLVQSRARKTWLVPNALRRAFFDTPLPARSTSRPILLNIGTIYRLKQQLELLGLAEQLHSEGLHFEMQFVGTADHRDAYAAAFLQKIKHAEKAGFARFLNPKSVGELIVAYDEASALVHAPTEESFGLVVAEALSRNLKFFGADVGGLRDIANGAEGAELFQLGSMDSLKDAISNWFTAGCPRPQDAAREMRSRYHPDVIALKHIEVYREVLTARNG